MCERAAWPRPNILGFWGQSALWCLKKTGAEGADTFTCNVLTAKNGEIVKIERNLICEVQMLACGRGQVI